MIGVFAGFFDSISGGGGLLTIPAMLIAGVPPLEALGTNKLQGIFGTASATITFASKGHLDFRSLWPIAFAVLYLIHCGCTYYISYTRTKINSFYSLHINLSCFIFWIVKKNI